MKLYSPAALRDAGNLLQRLDPPISDTGILTTELELPVSIDGSIVASGGSMAIVGKLSYASDQPESPERLPEVTLIGFEDQMLLYQPRLDEMADLWSKGSLRMPDMSFPPFQTRSEAPLGANVMFRVTFLGVDPATDEAVVLAVRANAHLADGAIPNLARQVPANLVGKEDWFDRNAAPILAKLGENKVEPELADTTPSLKTGKNEPEPAVNQAKAEAVRQAALSDQHTGQIGDEDEYDTPEEWRTLEDRTIMQEAAQEAEPAIFIPVRPSRALGQLPGSTSGPVKTLAK
jgi:hypothetical protein